MSPAERLKAAYMLLADIPTEFFASVDDRKLVARVHDLRFLTQRQADAMEDCPILVRGRQRQLEVAKAEAARERQAVLDQVAALLRPKAKRRRVVAR